MINVTNLFLGFFSDVHGTREDEVDDTIRSVNN